MKTVIRVDSSTEIGTGHLMRCLTLAKALREHGHSILFICKNHVGNIAYKVEAEGFDLQLLTVKAEVNESLAHSHWLGGTQLDDAKTTISMIKGWCGFCVHLVIVDHYGIDDEWEKKVYEYSSKLLVIDDLADRKHFCDYLLDQTFGRKSMDYNGLVDSSCALLLGAQFALLRPEFSLPQSLVKGRRMKIETLRKPRVLIMMGGTDHLNVSEKVLNVLLKKHDYSDISIILGPTAPYYSNLLKYSKLDSRIKVLSDISNVSELMLEHDICFGAAGTASWERCAVGLPSILVAFASNQKKILSMINKYGAAYTFELSSESSISEAFNQLQDIKVYQKMVHRCIEVCDGQGIQRVLKRLSYA